jgi:hypothetical protein
MQRRRGVWIRVLALVVLVSGCSADAPPCVIETGSIYSSQRAMDFLLVVDGAPDGPARTALLAKLHLAAQIVDDVHAGQVPSVRVAVVPADLARPARLAPPPACGVRGAFLVDLDHDSGTRERNFDGAFSDAVECWLGETASREAASFAPLDALAVVLAAYPDFVGAGDELVVVVVGTRDDASVGELDAVEAALRAPRSLTFSVITGPCADASGASALPTPRLDGFADRFPYHSHDRYCDAEWPGFWQAVGSRFESWVESTPCLVGALTDDVDPAQPGLQLDCEVVDRHLDAQGNAHETPLPPCPAGGASCWFVDPLLTCDSEAGDHLRLQVHRVADVLVPDYVIARCAAPVCAAPGSSG